MNAWSIAARACADLVPTIHGESDKLDDMLIERSRLHLVVCLHGTAIEGSPYKLDVCDLDWCSGRWWYECGFGSAAFCYTAHDVEFLVVMGGLFMSPNPVGRSNGFTGSFCVRGISALLLCEGEQVHPIKTEGPPQHLEAPKSPLPRKLVESLFL